MSALQRASDGSQNHEEESEPVFGKVIELQDMVDRQTTDLGQMKERMAAMVSRISELEEDLDTARKDLIKSEDMNTRLQRDLREVWRSIHLGLRLNDDRSFICGCSRWLKRKTWRRGSPRWRNATWQHSGRPRPSTTSTISWRMK